MKGILIGVLSVALSAAPALAQGPVDRPVWFIGESWTYDATDHVKNAKARLTYEVTRKSETGYAVRFTRTDEGGSPRVSAGNRSLDLNRLRKVGDAESDSGWFRFPLQVNAPPWKAKELWSNGEGFEEHTFKIVGWEKVTVPAGTFDAFRIESEGWWTDTSMRWGKQYSNRSTWLILYAPELKSWVELRYRSWDWQGKISFDQTEKLVSAKVAVDGNFFKDFGAGQEGVK